MTTGSSRPCRWASDRSRPSTRRASSVISRTAICSNRPIARSGVSSATARPTNRNRSVSIALASREELDNLIFVVNCNLQRLDGPVRGNGQIIQELEAVFRGVGWNVIKVIWGSEWDQLLARDDQGLLVQRMGEVVDGEYQKYTVAGGGYIRNQFWGVDPRLLQHGRRRLGRRALADASRRA